MRKVLVIILIAIISLFAANKFEYAKVKVLVTDNLVNLEINNPEIKGEKKPETPLEKYRAIKANMKNF